MPARLITKTVSVLACQYLCVIYNITYLYHPCHIPSIPTPRFEEQDVMILATLLNAVGLQLRADDPAAMKVRGVCMRPLRVTSAACLPHAASAPSCSPDLLQPWVGGPHQPSPAICCATTLCRPLCPTCLCVVLPLPLRPQDFVIGVHEAAAKARARGAGGLTKRAELMLELVMDIKNNR